MQKLTLFALTAITAFHPLQGQNPKTMIEAVSAYQFSETVTRADSLIRERGLRVLERIDHSANAQDADLRLPPTVLILFGNPRVGTPLMRCGRSVAIDLPQKMLIWEDDGVAVRITVNDPAFIAERHGMGECGGLISRIQETLRALVTEVAGG